MPKVVSQSTNAVKIALTLYPLDLKRLDALRAMAEATQERRVGYSEVIREIIEAVYNDAQRGSDDHE